jgi:hypothetical protein
MRTVLRVVMFAVLCSLFVDTQEAQAGLFRRRSRSQCGPSYACCQPCCYASSAQCNGASGSSGTGYVCCRDGHWTECNKGDLGWQEDTNPTKCGRGCRFYCCCPTSPCCPPVSCCGPIQNPCPVCSGPNGTSATGYVKAKNGCWVEANQGEPGAVPESPTTRCGKPYP